MRSFDKASVMSNITDKWKRRSCAATLQFALTRCGRDVCEGGFISVNFLSRTKLNR